MSDLLQWMTRQCQKPIKGVLHIGANTGQEAAYYSKNGLNVIWIEGDPQLYQSLKQNIAPFGQMAYQCLASDIEGQEVDFYIASNEGGSSSVLRPDKNRFAKEWPGVQEVKSIRLHTRRLDNLFNQEESCLENINLIVADVQGYELQVLRGLGSYLRRFEVVIAEVNWTQMYEGVTNPIELEAFLVSQGYKRAWLGVNCPQASGVWHRCKTSLYDRLFMAVTIRIYYAAAKLGMVTMLKNIGILQMLYSLYCFVKKRKVGK